MQAITQIKIILTSCQLRCISSAIQTMQIIIQTPRLLIREFLPEEEDIYLGHFDDAEVCLYLPKRTRAERSNIFRAAVEQYSDDRSTGTWGIYNSDNGMFIGSCLLRQFDNEPGKIELGYSLNKPFWGKGIGTEMAVAMVTHGFLHENIHEIVAVTDLDNIASQRVLEKAGFRQADNMIRNGEELAFFKAGR